MFQTTSRCNAKCVFCPYPRTNELFRHGTMSNALFMKIINECALNAPLIDAIIPYLMNEPLMDKNIIKKIEIIKEKIPGIDLHILTNGMLLDKNLSDNLIASPIDWVGISFFSLNKEKYEHAMGIPFEIAKVNVTNFVKKALKKRNSEFVMITFFKNDDIDDEDIQQSLDYWKKLGVKRIMHYEKGISRAGNVPLIPSPVNKKMNKCDSIWTEEMIHILDDGSVILCCMDWERKHILGNVNNMTIEEIWNSDSYKKIRAVIRGKAPIENAICKYCEMANF
ncbi:MAG: radical SAM protein [uncultured bacterium]|nr:MAG: radical SAM protein [uncultured bacterium]